ncbi:DUF2065 domain-containing protein [Henriciella sp. AS95]|uniref:DUF2065 domain-containing protein n=1 Tax=Henriciella sp. AS95 TaxID=3135782 RepID=UPI0031784EE8
MLWCIILAAIGLWFAIEGILYAAAPETMKRMADWLSKMPVESIRSGGIWSALLGIVIFYAAIRFA